MYVENQSTVVQTYSTRTTLLMFRFNMIASIHNHVNNVRYVFMVDDAGSYIDILNIKLELGR